MEGRSEQRYFLLTKKQWQGVLVVAALALVGSAVGAGVTLRSEIANTLGFAAPRIGVTSGQPVDSSYFLCRFLNSCK